MLTAHPASDSESIVNSTSCHRQIFHYLTQHQAQCCSSNKYPWMNTKFTNKSSTRQSNRINKSTVVIGTNRKFLFKFIHVIPDMYDCIGKYAFQNTTTYFSRISKHCRVSFDSHLQFYYHTCVQTENSA